MWCSFWFDWETVFFFLNGRREGITTCWSCHSHWGRVKETTRCRVSRHKHRTSSFSFVEKISKCTVYTSQWLKWWSWGGGGERSKTSKEQLSISPLNLTPPQPLNTAWMLLGSKFGVFKYLFSGWAVRKEDGKVEITQQLVCLWYLHNTTESGRFR